MNIYKIHKKSLAYELIAQGNILLDKELNKKDNNRWIYIFKDSEKLHNDLTELHRELHNNR
ncbi:hypothetical protein [Clostridium sp. UBA5988]|uniref:hypothetical protein n=1 Tax=Clostridium sp. UBA5988 TaxID=1946369 RepID=UPI003217F762